MLQSFMATLALSSIAAAMPFDAGYFNTSASLGSSTASSSSSCSTDVTLTSISSVTIYGSSSVANSTTGTATAIASSTATPFISGEFTNDEPIWSIYIPQSSFSDMTGFSIDSEGSFEGFSLGDSAISLYSGSLDDFSDISSTLDDESTNDTVAVSFNGRTTDEYLKLVISATASESQGSYTAAFDLYIDELNSTKRETLDYYLEYTIDVDGFVTTNTYLSCSGTECVTTSSTGFIATGSAITSSSEPTSLTTITTTTCSDGSCQTLTTTGYESVYTTTDNGEETVVTDFIPITGDQATATATGGEATVYSTVICTETKCSTEIIPVSSEYVYTTSTNGEEVAVTSYAAITSGDSVAAATGYTSSVDNCTSILMSGSTYLTTISGQETVVTDLYQLSETLSTVTTTDAYGKTTVYTTVCPNTGASETPESTVVSGASETGSNSVAAATGYTSSVVGNRTSIVMSGSTYLTTISGQETVVTDLYQLSETLSTVTTTDAYGKTTVYTTVCPNTGASETPESTAISPVVETVYLFNSSSPETTTSSTISQASKSLVSSQSYSTVTTVSNGKTTVYLTTCPDTTTTKATTIAPVETTEILQSDATVTQTEICTETKCSETSSLSQQTTVPIFSSSTVSLSVENEVTRSEKVYTSSVSGEIITLTTYYTVSSSKASSTVAPESTNVPAVSEVTANIAAANSALNAGIIGLAVGAMFML
ncbi:hypothetical protein FOA43_002748 [Brettanomyces nanus]|uniref:Uncharacterized protein n=1 Tax=Eeniella nana TaxID=13502 RepID=A0A875S8F8_EENNA|nr:uncharacterized protein FOA43_002748 [Brettanomyces nanus]QPG75394.1 hypothetical protein FOA43_002748 [Brettanomyces nanus]